MILIVTNRQDYTADFLILELQKRQADYVRFNTEDFPSRTRLLWGTCGTEIAGHIAFPRRQVDFAEIESIWYRRPVPPAPPVATADAAVYEFALGECQTLLDSIWRTQHCFWVSDPDNLRKAEFKLYQLKVATQIGLAVPPTIVTNDPQAAETFYCEQNESIVCKPLRHGRLVRGNNVSLIYTNPVGLGDVQEFVRLQCAPALFQRYIPKRIEIRATVIGTKVFAVEIHSQEHQESLHDWRRGDTIKMRCEPHTLPPKVESECLALVQKLGLAFGAIDLILTPDDQYVFLEINPNGQWAWIQQLVPEIPLRETLADLLMTEGRRGE